MSANPEHLEIFAPLKWATPLLKSPDWIVRKRFRGSPTNPTPDRFPRDTISAYDGMRLWLELAQRPATGSSVIDRTVSLCSFGPGLTGFSAICHGGAIMTMMDEALAFAMCANEAAAAGEDMESWNQRHGEAQKKMTEQGLPLETVLAGSFVTANLNVKFLRPVLCPGVVGIEVAVLEQKSLRLKMRAVMKDADGVPLVQADTVWVKLGDPKL